MRQNRGEIRWLTHKKYSLFWSSSKLQVWMLSVVLGFTLVTIIWKTSKFLYHQYCCLWFVLRTNLYRSQLLFVDLIICAIKKNNYEKQDIVVGCMVMHKLFRSSFWGLDFVITGRHVKWALQHNCTCDWWNLWRYAILCTGLLFLVCRGVGLNSGDPLNFPGIAIGGDVFPGSTLSDHVLRFNNIPQVIHCSYELSC